MQIPAFSKNQKYITGICAVVLLVLVIGGNMVAGHYKKIIHNTLPRAVAEATDSLYHISVKRVSINLLNRRITLRGVHIWVDTTRMEAQKKDSAAKRNYYDIVIPRLQVSGIMWDKLTGGEGYSCGTFSLSLPKIVIRRTQRALTKYNKVRDKAAAREFSASEVLVKGATFQYILGPVDTLRKFTFSKCDVSLDNWMFNERSIKDSSRFLLAEYGEIKAGKLHYEPPHSYYRLTIDDIAFNTADDKLTAHNLRFGLKVTEKEFLQSKQQQKEIYNLHFPTIEFDGIDRKKLLYDRELHVKDVYLNHSTIHISLNRLLPPNTQNKMGRFPNQLIQKSRLPLNIRRVVLNNGSIVYTETSEKTQKQASINFDNLNGEINNITNLPYLVQQNDTCIAKLDCKLNKNTDLAAVFNLSLSDPKGTFTANLDIQGLQGRQLTEQTKAFSLLEIRSLNMKSLQMQLTGNELAAKSQFTMLYSNLGIKILMDSTKADDSKKKKNLISFVANNLILYSANPMPGEQPRTINTYVERDPTKSFFNLVWKNILYGVRETTIRDMDIINWLQKNEKMQQPGGETKLKDIFKRNRKRARNNG